MGKENNLNQIAEDVKFLKRIVTNSREAVSRYRKIFIIWGLIIVLSGIVSYFFIINSISDFIIFIWTLSIFIGIILSRLFVRKTYTQFRINPFIGKIILSIWLCSSLGIFLFFFMSFFLNTFPIQYITAFSFIIIGISMIVTSVLFESKTGLSLGILFFIASIPAALFPLYSTIIQGVVMGGGLIFFGIKKNV